MRFKTRLCALEEYGVNIMRALQTLVVVGLIAIAGWTPTCAGERVDLLLVLAADISRSVDEAKFQLQRSGYAAAFSDSRVIQAIHAAPTDPVFPPSQPAGRACKLLSQQRHRWRRRVRCSRGELQFLRQRDHQKADRGDCASCTAAAGGKLTQNHCAAVLVLPGSSASVLRGRWPSRGIAEKARIGRRHRRPR